MEMLKPGLAGQGQSVACAGEIGPPWFGVTV